MKQVASAFMGLLVGLAVSGASVASQEAHGKVLPPEQVFALIPMPVPTPEPLRLLTVTVTAYNCVAGQTDSTPTVTASGMPCGGNVVAVSQDLLRSMPFGTRVRLQGRQFVIGDTMHRRFRNRIDIPFPSRDEAVRFGVQQRILEVLK